jgi:predicted transcriptional regulator
MEVVKMKKLHITVSEELKEKLKLVAEKKKRSLNFIANEALEKYAQKSVKRIKGEK